MTEKQGGHIYLHGRTSIFGAGFTLLEVRDLLQRLAVEHNANLVPFL